MATSNEKKQISANVPFARNNELLKDPVPTPDAQSQLVFLPGDLIILKGGLREYLSSQLDVTRLNVVHDRLWRAGLPGRVQPLHHQKLLWRNIVVTERIDLHLIWCVRGLPTFAFTPCPGCKRFRKD